MTDPTKEYEAHITDTTTGETRITKMTEVTWDDGSDSWWREGNFECDCNRGALFHRGGEGEGDNPCGSTRYRVKCIGHDGQTLFEDDDDRGR